MVSLKELKTIFAIYNVYILDLFIYLPHILQSNLFSIAEK